MVTANTKARFAPLNLAAERGGEAVGGDSFADPYPGLLEALLDQLEANQLFLQLWKQGEVHGGKIRRLGRVSDQWDGSGGKPVLGGGGKKDRSNVPAPNQCEEWS